MTSDPTTENTRQIVDLFWKNMGGDWATVCAFAEQYFAEDLEWSAVGTGVPGAGTHRGRDAVLQIIGAIRELFEPGHLHGEVIHLVVDGSWAAAETRVSALMRDGRRYENRYAFFIEVSGRKIRAVREYFDTYYVNHLIGEHL
jgi:ketosteroid isomerase-like protein